MFIQQFRHLKFKTLKKWQMFAETKLFMKHNFNFLFVLIFISGNAFAQHNIELTIKNIKILKGTIRLSVYNNETDFLKKEVASKTISVNAKEVVVSFPNLKAGNYAISAYHDVNENNELDSNFIGKPTEPYGFSNNAMGRFGPPAFDAAKVKLDQPVKLSIELR
jgi:uncharacterized protein (DUF2141 family)